MNWIRALDRIRISQRIEQRTPKASLQMASSSADTCTFRNRNQVRSVTKILTRCIFSTLILAMALNQASLPCLAASTDPYLTLPPDSPIDPTNGFLTRNAETDRYVYWSIQFCLRLSRLRLKTVAPVLLIGYGLWRLATRVKPVAKFLRAVTGTEKRLEFLEAVPFWDQSDVPVDTHTADEPFQGTVISSKRIVGPNATGETKHITIDTKGKAPFWEGQSYGVVPPGTREDGTPHAARLYSIASTRYGDDMTGKMASLCVRRVNYYCPELQADDPTKKGICSNYICDTKPGDEIQMTGPVGKMLLADEGDCEAEYIMVGTGTGVAPYRGFLRRLFIERTPANEFYTGKVWLFLGMANSDAQLYHDEFQLLREARPHQFRLEYALSREETNKAGEKMYIQDKMEEHADEIMEKLENGAHIYFCGLKSMMPGIQDMFRRVADSKGIDHDDWIRNLKTKNQWHVEVY